MRYIFDTSFLVSLINIDDINHTRSVERIAEIDLSEGHTFFVNELILSETYTVIAAKIEFEKVPILDSFLDKIHCQYLSGNFEEYFSFFKSLEGAISVADASVVIDAFKYSFSILAFDKKLLKNSQDLQN